MTLSCALTNYFNGDKQAFGFIWEEICKCIKWQNYYDPTNCYSQKDLKQECALHLYKNIAKWNPERGTFKTFAIFITYSKLNYLIKSILDRCNFYGTKRKNPSLAKFKNKMEYVGTFDRILDESKIEENCNYGFMVDLICSYFSDPLIREILEYLVNKDEKDYGKKDKEVIEEIAKKYGKSPRQVLSLIRSKKKTIKDLVG